MDNEFGLTVETIRVMKEQLCSLRPADPEKFVVNALLPGRGWFQFTMKSITRIELINDQVHEFELTQKEQAIILDEYLTLLDRPSR